MDAMPQTGSLGHDRFDKPRADSRRASPATADAKAVTTQTFMTAALAYTNPGSSVVMEPPPTGGRRNHAIQYH